MSKTFVISEQQLRDKALNAMLLALEAQSEALRSMDCEHSFGVENSFTINRLCSISKDFLQSTRAIVHASESDSLLEIRAGVRSLAAAAGRLKQEADTFRSSGQAHAKQRYEHLLMLLGDQAADTFDYAPATESPTPTDVGANPNVLSSQAGRACLRAEIDVFAAFSLQIHAICNLALEYALNAAVKNSHSKSNI